MKEITDYDLRENGDYAVGFLVSPDEAREALSNARQFVDEGCAYLKSRHD